MCETLLAEASKSPATAPEKELLTENLVVREAFFKSPATAPEKELDDVDHTFAGRPQEEGIMQQSSSLPWLQNQDYRTSRTWRRPARYQRHQKKRWCLARWRGPAHNHKQTILPQRNREVVNLSGLLNTKNKMCRCKIWWEWNMTSEQMMMKIY